MSTHFHADCSVDYSTLIKASYFGDRKKDLKVFGPAGNARMPAPRLTSMVRSTLRIEQGWNSSVASRFFAMNFSV